jgi:hypothetical protein
MGSKAKSRSKATAAAAAASGGPVPDLSFIAEPLRPLAVPIGDLVPDPANAKQHGKKNLAAIAGSLRSFGQRKPVVVRKDTMVVIAGNGTLQAALSLGWSHLAAVLVADDAATAAGYSIADNRTAEVDVEWDPKALDALLRSVQADDEDLAAMLNDLAVELDLVPAAEPTAQPPDGAASAEPRELFQVVIDCRDEAMQQEVLTHCTDHGIPGRALTIRE